MLLWWRRGESALVQVNVTQFISELKRLLGTRDVFYVD